MKIILSSYYWSVHALEGRFHSFEKGFTFFKEGFTFMKIILSSYYWGVHAFGNLIPSMNVLPSHLTRGQLVTTRE